MTYDQAQSPRLGQRTPIESTYVQIVDVTAGNKITDLVEAAYPGQLVFENNSSQLLVFDESQPGWRPVSGGIAGQVVYVGDEFPVKVPPDTFSVGDLFYDQDDGMKAYVWDGDSWEPSAGGITTYYENGFHLLDPLDPSQGYELTDPLDDSSPPVWYPITGSTVGDIWYQSDDGNHPYRWDGVAWQDARDPNYGLTNAVQTNVEAIKLLSQAVTEADFTARSADNSADTADGRISMSDYVPGPDDVLYTTTKQVYDSATDVWSDVEVQVPRPNGSFWMTRTRPRNNLCTNPSFEANDNEWTTAGATGARDDALFVPAGDWTYKVINSGISEPHSVAWGATSRVPCKPDQVFTASIYAELISGVGVGVTLCLVWCDASGSVLSLSTGTPYDLVLNVFDPTVLGTAAEPRLRVTDTAPAGAASFYVRVVSPAGNVNDQWHTGALLIEQDPNLGRYFDGESYDGHWDGARHNSTSYLEGTKITQLYGLRDENWTRKYFTDSTLFEVSATQLTGVLDGAQVEVHTLSPDKAVTAQVKASENLAPGDLVNVFNNLGEFQLRTACANPPREAHGFVLDNVLAGQMGHVYHVGYNEHCTNLAPGAQWVSTIPGKCTSQPPSAVGSNVQRVGHAPNSFTLDFAPMHPIRIV